MTVRYQEKKNGTQEEQECAKRIGRLGERDMGNVPFLPLKQADRYFLGNHCQMAFIYSSLTFNYKNKADNFLDRVPCFPFYHYQNNYFKAYE